VNPLFIGLGNSPVAWYRCGLPANALDYDWIGIAGGPKDPYILSGNVEEYEPEQYDVIVVQQLYGPQWLKQILDWQAEGKKVIYEIDDFIHGVWKVDGHTFQQNYSKKNVKKYYDPLIKVADAIICSTDFLAKQYRKFNKNQFVCKVCIDTDRYDVEWPEREGVVIGWSGGTGHHKAVGPWLEEVSKILGTFDYASFVSIGTRYAEPLAQRHPGQALSVPWTTLENYPYALTNIDIMIAPAHDNNYFLAKSDLRWLEASAVGIASVVDPRVYLDVEDGTTGLVASTPTEAGDCIMELVDQPAQIKELGQAAKTEVQKTRDIEKGKEQWNQALQTTLSN
jgi:glycosyltransferase involved in cell wall biosynthesis